jgi:hypothetical protein
MVPSRLEFRCRGSVNASDKSREQHGCPGMGMFCQDHDIMTVVAEK